MKLLQNRRLALQTQAKAKEAAEAAAAAAKAAMNAAKAATGAAPNTNRPIPGQPQEDETEKRARTTMGVDRDVGWTHHFDLNRHPSRDGLRCRVLCSAFDRAPWPPDAQRPVVTTSHLQRNVYDVTFCVCLCVCLCVSVFVCVCLCVSVCV